MTLTKLVSENNLEYNRRKLNPSKWVTLLPISYMPTLERKKKEEKNYYIKQMFNTINRKLILIKSFCSFKQIKTDYHAHYSKPTFCNLRQE